MSKLVIDAVDFMAEPRKKLCGWHGDNEGRCNRVAFVHINFIGLGDDAEGDKEFDVCDEHLLFEYWFYEKPINHSLRKGILVTPIWKDEDEYKKALERERETYN